jgi:hypothetical protein
MTPFDVILTLLIAMAFVGLLLFELSMIAGRTGRRKCPSCGERRVVDGCCRGCWHETDEQFERREWRKDRDRAVTGAAVMTIAVPFFLAVFEFRRTDAVFGAEPVRDLAWIMVCTAFACPAVLLLLRAWRGVGKTGPRCPKCGYDMRGVPGLVCPECGRTAKRKQGLYRVRGRRRLVGAAVALGLIGVGMLYVPRVQRGGPTVLIPATVMIAGLEWWPDWMIWRTGTREEQNPLFLQYVKGDLWDWQERWLDARCLALLRRGDSLYDVVVAARFLTFGLARPLRSDQTPYYRDTAVADSVALLNLGVVLAEHGRARDDALAAMALVPFVGELVSEEVADTIGAHTPDLIRVLGEPSEDAFGIACALLGAGGKRCEGAAPELLDLLASPDKAVVHPVVRALVPMVRESEPIRHAVVIRLPDMEQLGLVSMWFDEGCADPDTLKSLREHLRSDDARLASAACESLCRMRAEPDEIIPEIINVARSAPDAGLEIGRLGLYADALSPHLDALIALLGHPDGELSSQIAETLRFLADEMDDPRPLRAALPALQRERAAGLYEAASAIRAIESAIAEHSGD